MSTPGGFDVRHSPGGRVEVAIPSQVLASTPDGLRAVWTRREAEEVRDALNQVLDRCTSVVRCRLMYGHSGYHRNGSEAEVLFTWATDRS